jgi:outer membrane protein assembly factor BamB
MKRLLSVCLVVSLVFACVGLGHSSAENETCNWSCFKGNAQRTGVVPDNCSPDTGRLRLLWKQKIDDKGSHNNVDEYSSEYIPGLSPSVYEDSVFIGSRAGDLFCFDINTGSMLWDEPFHTDGSIFSTPAIYENRAFFGSDDGVFYCLNIETGKKIWSFGKEEGNIGKQGNPDDIRSSPVIHEERKHVYFGSHDNYIYCLYTDKDKAEKVWDPIETKGQIQSSLLISPDRETKLYCISGTGKELKIYKYLASRSVEDRYDEVKALGTGIPMIYSTPAFANDKLVFGTSCPKSGDSCSNGGKLYCYNAKTLVEDWVFDPERDDPKLKKKRSDDSGNLKDKQIECSPSIDTENNRVYFGTMYLDNSKLYCVDLETGDFIWSSPTGNYIRSSPAICDGKVYFGCHDGRVYCVDAESGEEVWHYQTPLDKDNNPRAINSSPAVADGKILIVSEDGNLYCFGNAIDITFQIENDKYQINNSDDEKNLKSEVMDVAPTIRNGRTLLSARYLVEPLGGKIDWDGVERKVTCNLVDITVELWIGKPTAKINGVEVQIDPDNPEVVPTIINDRTMVPMRFIAESLDCEVEWLGDTKEIKVRYIE